MGSPAPFSWGSDKGPYLSLLGPSSGFGVATVLLPLSGQLRCVRGDVPRIMQIVQTAEHTHKDVNNAPVAMREMDNR